MRLILSDQQRAQVISAGATPLAIESPSGQTYYLISSEQFERVRTLLDAEDIDPSFYEVEEIRSDCVQ